MLPERHCSDPGRAQSSCLSTDQHPSRNFSGLRSLNGFCSARLPGCGCTINHRWHTPLINGHPFSRTAINKEALNTESVRLKTKQGLMCVFVRVCWRCPRSFESVIVTQTRAEVKSWYRDFTLLNAAPARSKLSPALGSFLSFSGWISVLLHPTLTNEAHLFLRSINRTKVREPRFPPTGCSLSRSVVLPSWLLGIFDWSPVCGVGPRRRQD